MQKSNWIRRTSTAVKAGLAALLATASLAALADDAWPSKTVTLIVPFAPGGSTDVVARLVAQKLGEIWHQTVVVDNRAGAGGNIGAQFAAKAAPDGYTLLMASGSILTVNPFIYQKLPFDPVKDFAPITNVASGPMVVVVPTTSDVHSVKELIERAKAKPHGVNFGSAGIGSQVHMAGEKFADAAKIDVVHVPYRGEAPAYTDLMAGQIQFVVGNIGAVSSLVSGGRLRALAVTSKERSKLLPDVPTLNEAGLPGFDNTGWFGLLAPTGTPQAVVDKVYHDTVKILAETDVKARLFTQGMVPVGNAPADFTKAIGAETKGWETVVKNRGLAGTS
jgi:tripartite-type tricarboxylate transporter receptor subunit TctC